MEATQSQAPSGRIDGDGTTPRYITINLNKAIAIVTTAVLGAFVTGVAGALYTANSDHFKLVSVDGRVVAIENREAKYITVDVLTPTLKSIEAQLELNTAAINVLSNRINTHLDK